MKIAVGIDSLSQGELVLQAIHDLDFAHLKVRLAHVIEVWEGASFAGVEEAGIHLESYLKRIEDDARKFLHQLQGVAAKSRMKDVSSDLLRGAIGNELLRYVDKYECDLLALGSYLKTPIEGILEGSVGRKAIIHCPKSVLIAKESYRDGKELSAVLATDHSPAANRWIDQFIAWAPRGIRRIHVVAVIPEKMLEVQKKEAGTMDVSRWIHEGLAGENRRVLDRLAVLDMPCSSRVEVGNVGDCLARTMTETGAKLMILGAQGHGFMERMMMGSVSLEQAIKRPYSVLVVRT